MGDHKKKLKQMMKQKAITKKVKTGTYKRLCCLDVDKESYKLAQPKIIIKNNTLMMFWLH